MTGHEDPGKAGFRGPAASARGDKRGECLSGLGRVSLQETRLCDPSEKGTRRNRGSAHQLEAEAWQLRGGCLRNEALLDSGDMPGEEEEKQPEEEGRWEFLEQ